MYFCLRRTPRRNAARRPVASPHLALVLHPGVRLHVSGVRTDLTHLPSASRARVARVAVRVKRAANRVCRALAPLDRSPSATRGLIEFATATLLLPVSVFEYVSLSLYVCVCLSTLTCAYACGILICVMRQVESFFLFFFVKRR
jgi:hypothetical protein